MLDGLSLDQLRTFIAAVDEGSFSAAARRLRRAQSVVSQTLAKLEGQIGLGVVGSWAAEPPQLTFERLLKVSALVLVAPHHPLASYAGPIPSTVLAEYIHLIHVDFSHVVRNRGYGPQSPRTWRLAHLDTKLAFLRAGLGFASLPLPMVEADLANGTLVAIQPEDAPSEGYVLAISAVYRKDSPPGPAGRWFIDRLRYEESARVNSVAAPSAERTRLRARGSTSLRRLSASKPATVPYNAGGRVR
jgi:DNA-binding transcriptional LysR family regulator